MSFADIMNNKKIDDKDREVLMMLQKGIPVTTRPYKEIADMFGISEDELILRIKKLKEMALIKRIDFRLDLKRLGFVSTLVACRIPKREIPRARQIILSCRNITHNYLRKHELNMWFTLTAGSFEELRNLLAILKVRLKADELLSFQTKKIFKLGFRLNVN